MQIALNTRQPIGLIMSGSMEPEFRKGDVVFSSGVDAENIEVGDVIVYDPSELWEDAPGSPVAHRVIEKKMMSNIWYFLTKGDANSWIDDALIPEDRILGKVWGHVPYLGWIVVFLIESNLYISLSTIIVFIYIFIILSKKFIKVLR